MDPDTDFLYHYTPLLLVSGLGGSPCLSHHPSQKNGEQLAVPPRSIDHEVARDLHGRFRAKSNEHKFYDYLAPKASRKNTSHVLNVRFIDDTYRLAPVKNEEGYYADGQEHSPLSPRNPQSNLFPDGLISVEWVQKYLYLQPGVAVSFHLLGDTSTDAQLVKDLTMLKQQWTQRGTKFVAALICESSASDDRISHIRKSTGLEKRTGLVYILSSSSSREKETFVETICMMGYTQALEFYSSLCKKIRKKRGSQHLLTSDNNQETTPLTSAGWEARYSFKLAALAEFRQDLEGALKAYEIAYESIMELLEAMSMTHKNGRWKEAVMVVDVLSYKICKMCLYIDQPNVAYRRFGVHLLAMLDVIKKFNVTGELVDLDLWQARHYLRLAKLVELTDDSTIDKASPVAYGPDMNSVRLPRCGFLYLRSVELMRRSEGFDLEEPIFDALSKALSDFRLAGNEPHRRSTAYALYCHGEALVAKEDWVGALKSLNQAAEAYRQDSWPSIMKDILTKTQQCAKHTKDTDAYVKSEIELNVLDGRNMDTSRFENGFVLEGVISPFSAQFAFDTDTLHLGLPAKSQVSLTSQREWKLDEVVVEFKGLDNVELGKEEEDGVEFVNGTKGLVFKSGESKTVEITHLAHDLGEAEIYSIKAATTLGAFKYKFTIPVAQHVGTVAWHSGSGAITHKRLSNPHHAHIAPRPARIKMETSQQIGTAAAGELLSLSLNIDNQENEQINLTIDSKVSTNEGKGIEIQWGGNVKQVEQESGKQSYPFKIQVPTNGATGIVVEFFASYTLDSDANTIKDNISMSIPVVKPFRVNFDVSPRPHPDSWPSSFIPQPGSLAHSPLIHKRWDLTASLLFLGEASVVILGSALEVAPTNEGEAECSIVENSADNMKQVSHNEGYKMSYVFDTCRGEKEIRSVAAEAHLKIRWRRVDCDQENTFYIPVVRLNLPLHEPRVILDCSKLDDGYYKLWYYLENATSHILTYSVTMGSSSVFAFQGAKSQGLRVLPYTRQVLEYVLKPLDYQGEEWLRIPQIKIHDTYFKRTLVVVSASRDAKHEKNDLYIRMK